MPRRRRRPRIPVTLTLPAEAPSQAEIDAILMVTDAIIGQAGRNGVCLILNGSRSQKVRAWEWDRFLFHSAKGWERVKRLWVDRLLSWFTEWQQAGQPERAWPRMETIHREIKFLLLH